MDNMNTNDNRHAIVLDIIEYPQRYTSSQLEEILSDPETRGIYNLICKCDSTIKSGKPIDVDDEWKKFSRMKAAPHSRSFIWSGSRAAAIAAIIFTSLIAIAAGIAIMIAVKNNDPKSTSEKTSNINNISNTTPDASAIEPQDSIMPATIPVMFEDNSLADIMKTIAATYGVEIKFNNREAEYLHLYYRLDPSLTIDEIISQLNTFEQININHSGNTLTIE